MTPSDTSRLAAHLAAVRPDTPDPADTEPAQTDGGEPTTAIVPAAEAPPPAPDYSRVPAKVVGALPYASTYMRLAKTISGTELVPGALRGRPDAVMAAMMMGYELGLGPMQALNGVQVIDGKAGLSAELMRALVQQSGHQFILSQSNTEASVRCRRKEWPESEWATFTWTMEDAKRAGLGGPTRSGKPSGWQKYPRAMLAARVTSEACRATFADVLAGMSYTPEELEDMSVEAPPASAPSRRGRSRAAQSQAADVAVQGDSEPATAQEAEAQGPSDPDASPAEAFAAEAQRRADEATASADDDEPTPDAPAEPARGPAPVPGTHGELVKALHEVIKALPRPQQALVRAWLAQHGMGDPSKLSTEQLQQAINIAAGWPTSVQVDDPADPEDGDVVEGEIVDDASTGELPF